MLPLFFGVTYDYGYSGKQDNIFINDLKFAISYQVTSRLGISATLPFTKKVFSNANFTGSLQGIGDILLSSNYVLFTKYPTTIGATDYGPGWDPNNESSMFRSPKTTIDLDVGVKIPTALTNRNKLPLRYQAGMGTNDLLIGISYIPGPKTTAGEFDPEFWKFGLDFQIPFGIASNSIDSIRRGPDLVGRISYFNAIPNLDCQVELLAIKRLTKTKEYFNGPFIVTSESSPDPIDTVYGSYEIPKSDFFQVNLRLSAKYYFAKNTGLLFGAAIPFIKRGENSDGTERSYTLFCGISYLFGR